MNVQRTFICPYTEIPLIKKCTVHTCPKYYKNNETGCVSSMFKGELGIPELSYIFGVSRRQILKDINLSNLHIKGILLINNILSNYDSKNIKSCSKCGTINDNGLNCLNIKNCNKREKITNKYLGSYPFNIKELDINKQKFWFLVEKTKIFAEHNFIEDKDIKLIKTLFRRIT